MSNENTPDELYDHEAILDGFSDTELENALDARKARRDALAQARRESVEPRFEWMLKNITGEAFARPWDDMVCVFQLEGVCMNKDRIEAVGGTVPREGSMSYHYNKASGKFIGTFSGGTVWISCDKAFAEIASVIFGDNLAHLPGSIFNVTEIVARHRHTGLYSHESLAECPGETF